MIFLLFTFIQCSLQLCNHFDCITDCTQFLCNGISCPCDITTLSENIPLQQDRLTLYWQFIESNITLLIESNHCTYLALIFNLTDPNEFDFTNKDVLNILFAYNNSNIRVSDNIGVVQTTVSDIFLEGQQNWMILGFATIEDKFRLKVTRQTVSTDSKDFEFKQQTIRVGYIIGDNSIIIIQNYNRGFVDVPFGYQQQTIDKWKDFVQIGHVVFMFVFWGVLADIGVFFARYMRSYPKYAKVHGIIYLYIIIATYLYVFAMIEYNKIKIQEIYFYSTLIISHFIIGICIVALVTIQMFFGMIVKNNLESLNGSQKIYKIKLIHRIVGYFIYFITKIQVALGMHMYAPDLLIPFYGYYILLCFCKIANEILYYYQVSFITRERITYYYVEVDKNQIYETLLEKINLNTPRNQLIKEYPKLNYIILREAVYDVSDFNHPGGQYILERITGREIGRYFYGGYPITDLHIKMHIHSQYAINYIETRYIGDFKNESCPILYYEDKALEANDKHIWKFEEYRRMTNDTGLFVFQSHFFQVRQFMKGVQWLGRYFYIKPYGYGLTLMERPYSIVLCLSDVNIRRRAQILEFFKAQILEEDFEVQAPTECQELSNEIGFIIKRQNFSRNMSRFIHGQAHKPYELTGPYGLGLELDSISDGLHLVFCQGTGVLPFLDLIDFLLKKLVYQILYDQRGSEIAQQVVVNGEDYENTLGDDFQLVLHGAFKDKEQFYGLPLAQDLLFICKTFNLPIFEMYLRFSTKETDISNDINQVNNRFNYQYIKQHLKFKPSKIYICGSPQFESEITQHLRDLGIPKKLIVIV